MKVLKISALSGVNVGDLAISSCIEEVYKSSGMEIDSFDLRMREKKNFDVSTLLEKNEPKHSYNLVKRFPRLYNLLLRFQYSSKAKPRLLSIIKNYDCLMIGGGNLLFNNNGINFLESCYSCAKEFNKLGKPFSVISVGVGPFSCSHKKELKYLVVNSKYFSVRDNASKNTLLNILGKEYSNRINILPDPVILYPKLFDDKVNLCQSKKYFGVNVIDIIRSPQNIVGTQDLEILASNLIEISEHYKLKISLLSTAYNNDPKTLDELLKILQMKGYYDANIIYIESNDIGCLSKKLSDFKFILTYRMHLGILGNSIGIPSLTFKWQSKVAGVSEQYLSNYQKFLVSSPNFSFDEVVDKLDYSLGERNYILDPEVLLEQYKNIDFS
ncbi:polysaccharide pyruvyl transferase family protein [Vibrio cyclitrophicus]